MSILNIIAVILILFIPVSSYFLEYIDTHQEDAGKKLKHRKKSPVEKFKLLVMQLIVSAIAVFFFCLIIKFLIADAPTEKMDLFIAPMYLFSMSIYGGLAIILYSSIKKH